MKFFLKSGVKPCKHTNLYQFNKYTFFWKKNVDNIKANQKDDEYLYVLPGTNFLDFYSQLKKNIENLSKSPTKLDILVKEKGADKILSEVENMNKLIKEGKSGKDTFRYMEFNEFLKYKSTTDAKGKFMMPLFWGWTYPVIKYCSVTIINNVLDCLTISKSLYWNSMVFL